MAFRVNSDRKASVNKTIRFPVDLIREIEIAIECKDCTFSGFVFQAIRYAMENIEDFKKQLNTNPSPNQSSRNRKL